MLFGPVASDTTALRALEQISDRDLHRIDTRAVQSVDRRSVANPVQARTLLAAVAGQARSGPRLVAHFGCLYFAALRPEEAASLRKHNLAIPDKGWGELHLERAEPHAGRDWTDSGKTRDERQLKQRQVGESRTVPCPPELTALLNEHIDQFGTGPDGLLFRGERNGEELPRNTINRAWRRARASIFTPEVQASPLVATPYDLRHAAVSIWLNAGIPAADVAEWAGHSVEVLLKIYAKCLDGGKHVLSLGNGFSEPSAMIQWRKTWARIGKNARRAPDFSRHSRTDVRKPRSCFRRSGLCFGWLGVVPPAGFEPAPPPPEGGALSPELRGLSDRQRLSGPPLRAEPVSPAVGRATPGQPICF
jgi:integrase